MHARSRSAAPLNPKVRLEDERQVPSACFVDIRPEERTTLTTSASHGQENVSSTGWGKYITEPTHQTWLRKLLNPLGFPLTKGEFAKRAVAIGCAGERIWKHNRSVCSPGGPGSAPARTSQRHRSFERGAYAVGTNLQGEADAELLNHVLLALEVEVHLRVHVQATSGPRRLSGWRAPTRTGPIPPRSKQRASGGRTTRPGGRPSALSLACTVHVLNIMSSPIVPTLGMYARMISYRPWRRRRGFGVRRAPSASWGGGSSVHSHASPPQVRRRKGTPRAARLRHRRGVRDCPLGLEARVEELQPALGAERLHLLGAIPRRRDTAGEVATANESPRQLPVTRSRPRTGSGDGAPLGGGCRALPRPRRQS